MINLYIDKSGNLYRENTQTNTIKRVNCLKWGFLNSSEFELIEKVKINKHKYNTLLNEYYRDCKIEWEYNGETFKALDCIEVNNYGGIDNYILVNNSMSDKIYDKPTIPYFDSKTVYGHVFIAMFRGVVGYVSPYTNGGYQFLDIKDKKFKQWVTLKNLRPILNVTRGKIIGSE